jgi:hypothetical protein
MQRLAFLILFSACSAAPGAPGLHLDAGRADFGGQDAGTPNTSDGGQVGAPVDAGIVRQDAGGGSTQGPDCRENADCEEGLVCEGEECVPRLYGCRTQEDCHEGAWCDETNGLCLTFCDEDEHCPEGTRCGRAHTCLQPCDQDDPESCPRGTTCKSIAGIASWPFCGTDPEGILCGPGGTCPPQTRCDFETGFCDEDLACSSDRDCPSDYLCEYATGDCISGSALCTSDRTCADDVYCHPAYRRCLPRGYCERHGDCANGEGCHPDLQVCTGWCRRDFHCGEGGVCDDGFCRP